MQINGFNLTNCAEEPIHIPGAIQPHGILLAISELDLGLLQVSRNIQEWVAVDLDAAGGPALPKLDSLLAADSLARLQAALATSELRAVNPLRLDLLTRSGPQPFDGIAHRSGGVLILELEPSASDAESVEFFGFYNTVHQSVLHLQEARTYADAVQFITAEVKRVTGFGRVMSYQFDADWNGKVVAEVVDPSLPSYLGMSFPHSDIPVQARRLYTESWLRLIVDVDYVPAPLHPAANPRTGAPLDLSFSTLRSVSPLHLEYLRNMGVRASMSISIMKDDKLWGLIACHDAARKFVSYQVRSACEFLGQIFSYQLTGIEAREDLAFRRRLKAGSEKLARSIASRGFIGGFSDYGPDLIDLVGAGGAALIAGDDVQTVGATPPADALADLAAWVHRQDIDAILATHHLAAVLPAAAAYAHVAAGLLAMPIGNARESTLLWFRPEVIETVSWAGNPEKALRTEDGREDGAENGNTGALPAPRLHPRTSFAAWKEIVKARSLPWLKPQIDAALDLRISIVSAEVSRLNLAFEKSNQELDAFAHIAAHDLKEPVRGIHNYASFILEDEGPQLSADAHAKLQAIMRQAERLHSLLGALYEYSRVGRVELAMQPVDLNAILAEVCDHLAAFIAEKHATVTIPAPLPTVRCDRVRVGEVFYNLISNAIKYNNHPQRRVTVTAERRPTPTGGEELVYAVADDGIGIDSVHFQSIFAIYKRLHGKDKFGGGTGTGLTIAKRIVEMHGGRIWLASQPGKGTCFFFTLQ